MILRILAILLLAIAPLSYGASTTVKNVFGEPMSLVMITRTPLNPPPIDIGDKGYPPHGITNTAAKVITHFSDTKGKVSFKDMNNPATYRVRAQGHIDVKVDSLPEEIVMEVMSPRQYVASFPSNVWLSQLAFGGNEELKKKFLLNCAFCHQQASQFMRNERTEEQWITVIERMNTYGARLPNEDHAAVAAMLRKEFRELRENPEQIPLPHAWEAHLSKIEITEWPIGDGFSQMHDFLLHPNGYIYIGDNLFDRIYELDPANGEFTVYKVPHATDMNLGGNMGNRFKVFPKMDNYMGVHSFAYSKKDGNIFITPSMQQALLEFNVTTKKFVTHDMPEGFYPHTIRTDEQDRVWFTLAVSNQVAMFDRTKQSFSFYDFPTRGFKEWLIIKALPILFSFNPDARPNPSPDRESTGLPMPYGIEVAPNGKIWVARLYANDLAKIDPDSGKITMIDFPYNGPRRLRADADGNLWIVAFQDSLLVKYDPNTESFTSYELPVVNEVPYALNVDRQRGMVWVNGNQSDTILGFDIASENWKVYPMPRQRFFTRDIEISEEDGAVYTTNSHFPTWQSEGGTPTLLRITPLEE